MFATTVAALAPDHRVIVWDMPGHGRSAAPDDAAQYSVRRSLDAMLGLLDAAGAEQAVLLGHSLGGFLSLELALAHPERVRGLVLVDTGPGYRNDVARDGWNEMATDYAVDLEAKGLDGLPGGAELSRRVHASAAGLAHTARRVLTQHDAHVIDALGTITAPTLVVVGAKDAPFVKGSHYMASKIPGAELVVIDGCGHAPPITHPEPFNAALRSFLGGLP
jgi:pimeloyl-ACP methyl ester carboxylesterase